jgi:hypothetical protein
METDSGKDSKAKIKQLHDENVRLNELITKCQDKIHSTGLEVILL